MSIENAAQLWQRLAEAGLVEGERVEGGEDAETQTPWFVRLMLGFAGWLAALCLTAFVALFLIGNLDSPGTFGFFGLISLSASVLLYRAKGENIFLSQLAFALSLGGSALIAFAFGDAWRHPCTPLFCLTLLFAALFFAIPSFTHRVWAAWMGSALLVATVFFSRLEGVRPDFQILPPVAGVFSFLVAEAWRHSLARPKETRLWQSGASGLTLTVVSLCGWVLVTGMARQSWRMRGFLEEYAETSAPWIMRLLEFSFPLLASLAFLWMVWHFVRSVQKKSALFALALLIALCNLKFTGLAPALMLLLIGFGQGNRVLAGLGLTALLLYLGLYYYALEVTLLVKSAWLSGTGAALLVGRVILGKLWPEESEHD
jgi:hypothetical protein